MSVDVRHGKAEEELRRIPDASIGAIVTDPPYGLSQLKPEVTADVLRQWGNGDDAAMPTGRGFMGKSWDAFVPPPALWREALRVLKPGGYALVFAGSRTQDLMGASLRFAGFDIVDCLSWLRANGMPKGAHVGARSGEDSWRGFHTRLKPAYEPILVAQRPPVGGSVANVLREGVGAFDIDSTRIPFASEADRIESVTKNQHGDFGSGAPNNRIFGAVRAERTNYDGTGGRFTPNVVLEHDSRCREVLGDSGSDTVFACVPDCPSRLLEAQAPGSSRFFFQGKANSRERPHYLGRDGRRVEHPTAKPVAVMDWLVTLVTPPGETVLDPFAGSGTTGEAAAAIGRDCVLIERDEQYIPLIHQRLRRHEVLA